MSHVNLTLMQTFYLVAREGSYSGAARRLNISYQSAANHVRRLEQSLGCRLVVSEQGMKTNELTARGKKLYQLLMPEFDTMLERLSKVLSGDAPLIRVGMPTAMFYYLFPDVIAEFEKLHPDAEILCFERDISLVSMVTAGQLDAFITERTVVEREVRQYLMGSYGLSLIYPSSWPEADPDNLADWADGRAFITYEPGHIIRNMALRHMSKDDKKPKVRVSTSVSSSIKRCVTRGLGFAILPTWTAGELDAGTTSMPLKNWPRISAYFGEATYLENNPYIRSLRELCLTHVTHIFEAT